MFGIAIPVLLIYHYYQTMYGKYAYQTHLLPLKGNTIFQTKWTGVIIFTIISGLLGLALLTLFAWLGFKDFDFEKLLSFIRQIPSKTIWIFLAIILVNLIFSTTLCLFCINRGSENDLKRFGIGGPILVYIISDVVIQVVSLILMMIVPFGIKLNETSLNFEWTSEPMLRSFIQNPAEPDVLGLGGIILSIILLGNYTFWRARKSVSYKLSGEL